MPPPRFAHRFQYDVFVSYAHKDDVVDPSGRRWVSQFFTDLKARLEQVSGRSIEIWRDDRLGGADVFDEVIRTRLRSSAVLLTILSPNYFSSTACGEERDAFIEAAGTALYAGEKARIVKVAK